MLVARTMLAWRALTRSAAAPPAPSRELFSFCLFAIDVGAGAFRATVEA